MGAGMAKPKTNKDMRVVPWRQRIIALFTQPIKLPGWAAAILAVIIFFPDWHSRIEFWLSVAKAAGGYVGMIAAVIASPYFSPALFVGGLLWVLLIGEPKKGVQRRHWLRYVGWSIFLICFTTVIVTAGYGAIEFYIQREVSARDTTLQKNAAIRPVFWHMTDAEKTALAIELDKIPEADRFEVKVKCLPDAGSRSFVEEAGKIFIDHHWKITANCFFSDIRPDLTGLYVGVPKEQLGKKSEDLPKNLRLFLGILNRAQISGKGIALDEKATGDEFSLIVGNAP
jgi:hypothetical protein